jgi:hypothetical protein
LTRMIHPLQLHFWAFILYLYLVCICLMFKCKRNFFEKKMKIRSYNYFNCCLFLFTITHVRNYFIFTFFFFFSKISRSNVFHLNTHKFSVRSLQTYNYLCCSRAQVVLPHFIPFLIFGCYHVFF